MKIREKILYSVILFLVIAAGTAKSLLPFYNRTPWGICSRLGLAVILLVILNYQLIWKKK
ncbi:MAG: hypothetical protein IKD46_00970 [Lentisphaeria bacterium]|nr:hypothetical protein [Lentisphaeria bacterium]